MESDKFTLRLPGSIKNNNNKNYSHSTAPSRFFPVSRIWKYTQYTNTQTTIDILMGKCLWRTEIEPATASATASGVTVPPKRRQTIRLWLVYLFVLYF